ncbi:MAG: ribonuclease HII, partial [Candidatus Saccharimonadales bacterium]
MGFLVVGIDEVGRGCIAGPLVVGAVALNHKISGLKDSKVLSRTRREILAPQIYKEAIYFGLGWASSQEVDELGLTKALTLASRRALSEFSHYPAKFLLDGNYNYLSTQYRP